MSEAQAATPTAEEVGKVPTAQIPETPAMPEISQMPTTPEQLKLFCVWAFNDMISNPANASILATHVVNGLMNSLRNDQQRLERDMVRPVLIKQYVPGSVRATTVILENDEQGQQLGGTLEIQNKDGAWEPLDKNLERQEVLIRLLLAKATIPGEVWFFTTSNALEAAAAAGAEVLQKANGL